MVSFAVARPRPIAGGRRTSVSIALGRLLVNILPALLLGPSSSVALLVDPESLSLYDAVTEYDQSRDETLDGRRTDDFELDSPLNTKRASEAEGPVSSSSSTLARSVRRRRRALGKAWTGTSKFSAGHDLGIGAMQLSLVSDDELICSFRSGSRRLRYHLRLVITRSDGSTSWFRRYDKAENNPAKINGHSAWGQVYTISTGQTRTLNLITNSFCAGGGWLSNGTLVSVGGNPAEGSNPYAANGIGAIRLFTPCDGGKCDVQEYPTKIRLTSNRWYASTVRVFDGSIAIWGGMLAGGYNNQESTDNPTIEYFPPKGDGLQIQSKFLHDALNSNLFPIIYQLPQSGHLFVVSNKLAMIYDWQKNQEYRLPDLPNGVTATYPASAMSVLLPLTIANRFGAEILICGGSMASIDSAPWKLTSETPSSRQCARIKVSGTSAVGSWAVEQMPEPRIMGDAILTPDGKVLFVNGAKTGVAGYGNVQQQVGQSNAANPDFRPTLYDPLANAGSRFSTNFPASQTERLYHSSASLLPDGRIFIAGSNPNSQVSTTTYKTRFNTEFLSPPYMSIARPSFSGQPTNIKYKQQYTFPFTCPTSTSTMRAVIMDIGYSTHGVHMNQRWVELTVVSTSGNKITVKGPGGPTYYPPGYAWLFLLADDVPSKGKRVMISTGANPPSSTFASQNLLAKTKLSQ